jgi:hypothetical protein
MGDLPDGISRHWAKTVAGCSHEGLLTKQIQDARNAA